MTQVYVCDYSVWGLVVGDIFSGELVSPLRDIGIE